MTVLTADPLKAICAFLRVAVGSLLDPIPEGIPNLPAGVPAVFRPDLPQGITPFMPMRCIIVRPYGGFKDYGTSMLPLGDPTVGIICLGGNTTEASSIADNVVYQLQLTGQAPQEWEDCWIYSATVKAGPVPLPDTQTLWSAMWLSATVLVGQLPAGR